MTIFTSSDRACSENPAFEENNFEIDYRELQELIQNDSELNNEISEVYFDQMERSILDNFDDHQVRDYIENEKRNYGVNKNAWLEMIMKMIMT